MSELAVTLDGTVVMTHHTGWSDKGRARGGSQLEADPDGVILLQKHDPDDPATPVSVTRKKDKEGPAGGTVWVQRTSAAESCVVELIDKPDRTASKRTTSLDADREESILAIVRDHPWELTETEVLKEAKGNRDRTRAVFKDLIARHGLVVEKRHRVEGQGERAKSRPRDLVGLGAWKFRPAGTRTGETVRVGTGST